MALIALLGAPARAFDFLDGRLEVHGFTEAQVRAIARDFDGGDDWDLTQWYNVLDLEIEAEIAPDGWGPFELVSGFARIEARYDCIWKRGCGLFDSVNAFGNRAEHLPGRVVDGHRAGHTGSLFTGDLRRYAGIPPGSAAFDLVPPQSAWGPDQTPGTADDLGPLPLPDLNTTQLSPNFQFVRFGNEHAPLEFHNLPGIGALFGSRGPDARFGTLDDPAAFVWGRFEGRCLFASRATPGNENGVGSQIMGPWNPACDIDPIGSLRNRPNPFNPADVNPVLRDSLGADQIPGSGDEPASIAGTAAQPYRPSPLNPAGSRAPLSQAKGIYYPNARLARLLRENELDSFDQNFREEELAWNRGASQQNEKELKELYLDFELFDSRLWIRAGKQNIVWGKTELFRTTDQFNPQDLALASLPSFEESRVALWAVRSVYSFYDVGPFEDVRFEIAFNYDQFEPADLGRCGEPYTPNPVCTKSFGLLAHGLTGIGLAGEARPPNPWDSLEGIELGGRLEFRWQRFSFQVSDFYGYEDFPYLDRIFDYSRNVDPRTGRPRRLEDRGECTTGAEPACLRGGTDALLNHSANQQLFAMICATSVGFSNLDRSACAQSVLNSRVVAGAGRTVARAVASLLSFEQGGISGNIIFGILSGFSPGATHPFVDLNADGTVDPLGDLPLVALTDDSGAPVVTPGGLGVALSSEQQALLGCGALFGTSCNEDGADLLNAEASVIAMSWPGIEGTSGDWDVTDGSVPQPGTVDFVLAHRSPLCTRYEDGLVYLLPGCRGPTFDATTLDFVDVGTYDPAVDGIPPNTPITTIVPPSGPAFTVLGRHPFACTAKDAAGNVLDRSSCQPWASEMAALSWNALMAFVALSSVPDDFDNATGLPVPGGGGDGIPDRDPLPQEFDPNRPLRTDGCSMARPQHCSAIAAVFGVLGVQRNVRRAGGNGTFGRRDFVWHGGADLVLRYERRNVLGFAFDFAEDRTKSNWSAEFTWMEGLHFGDANRADGDARGDTFNLTVSADRPTFINFLNPNRTMFFNTQWFFQYVDGYEKGFSGNGPVNVLATFTLQTGYFQDRLLPSATWVYDMRSRSGGFLPSVTYRFSQAFSATVGLNAFWGRWQSRPAPLAPPGLGNRTGRKAYSSFVENGLSVVRDRDEAFVRIRYTF